MPAVVASEKGVVVGRLTFSEAGDHIDCQKMGVGGKAIPPNVDKVRTCSVVTGREKEALPLSDAPYCPSWSKAAHALSLHPRRLRISRVTRYSSSWWRRM